MKLFNGMVIAGAVVHFFLPLAMIWIVFSELNWSILTPWMMCRMVLLQTVIFYSMYCMILFIQSVADEKLQEGRDEGQQGIARREP